MHESVDRSYPGRGDFFLSCPVPHCHGVIFIVLNWCKIFSLASLMKTNRKYSVTRGTAWAHHTTLKRMLTLGEHEWHSGESACLQTMWLGFSRIPDLASYSKKGLCLSLVLDLALRMFRRVIQLSSLHIKPSFPILVISRWTNTL